MTKEQVAEVLAEKLRTDLDLRRSLGMDEGYESGLLDGEPAVGFTDGDGDQHFITVEDA